LSDAIFIAGYYRSGTSALAGALQRLGVGFHNDAEPNEHNPLGFYEIPELIEFDNNLFLQLGVEWTDVRGLPDGWWDRADLARPLSRLDEILRRRFGHEKLWGLKHPHLCRLLPLYERAVALAGHRPHVIHICRSPWAVAASQHKKNGISRAHAVLLWLTYIISAERHARLLPRNWLTYDDLLANPGRELLRIQKDLGIALSVPKNLPEARNFLTATLNRSQPVPRQNLFGPVNDLAAQVWDAVQSRDHSFATWDGFAVACADLTGFVAELGQSKGVVIPGFGAAAVNQAAAQNGKAGLRPAERVDEGARQRLLKLKAEYGALPSLNIVIAVPPNRAPAIHATLESIRTQWHKPARIMAVSADPLELPGITVIAASAEAGAVTASLCRELNAAASGADYVAIMNAGETIEPDACLRFTLEAANSRADMIYCDEIVETDQGGWVRYKPAWDITRLRQAAFIGDWVWYRGKTLLALGGFNPDRAGAEEYDYQLRLAETPARIVRLPEAVFTRAQHSRRDNIPSTIYGPRAVDALADHLRRSGIAGEVQPRAHLGLFRHIRNTADPGTSVIMLCEGLNIATIDRWMTNLLSVANVSGAVILAGAALTPPVATYLRQVVAQSETLREKVRAVMPDDALTRGAALRAAIGMVSTELVAVLDGRSAPLTKGWLDDLRHCLADPGVAAAGARTLLPLANDPSRYVVQGPIIIGADTRLGAGHDANALGPGGWLAVEQEASAVAPSAVLFRTTALAACPLSERAGDALWIDLCAHIRAAGHRIVWTPDVSFLSIPDAIRPDPAAGIAACAAWEDPYHHPALSLRGDLLAPEQKHGIVRSGPADPRSLLLTGPVETGAAVINAARALRGTGMLEAGWAPDILLAAEIARRAPSAWVRINPETAGPAGAKAYIAVYTTAPKPEALPALAAATHVIATSPALQRNIARLMPPGGHVDLWRPALSRPVWHEFQPAPGLDSKPRILWIDEGIAPPWFPALINSTASEAAWIVMERPGVKYAGAIAQIKKPEDEHSWARDLATLGPNVLVRPAEDDAVDCYVALLAAAAGCHILQDARLDVPAGLNVTALPNRETAWRDAVLKTLAKLQETLGKGQKARAAALALPAVEDFPPPWAGLTMAGITACAAG